MKSDKKKSSKRTGRLITTIIFGVLLAVGGWFWGNTWVAGTLSLVRLVDIGDLEGVRYVARWDAKQLNRAAPVRKLRRDEHGLDLDDVHYEPIQIALRAGRLDIAGLLLDLGAEMDFDKTDEAGRTRLHSAVADDKMAAARFMLEAGSSPNTTDDRGATPLQDAAAAGKVEMVQLLLAHQAAPNARNADGKTALQLALDAKHTDVVKVLMANGADPAVALADPNARLYAAAAAGDDTMVALLLKNGANPDQTDKAGRSPLFHAGSAAVAQLLLDAGADPGAKDRQGRTPLHCARSGAVVRLLVTAGAKPETHDRKGLTPLYVAAEAGRSDVVKALIESGAEINAVNDHGARAIDYAARAGHAGVIEVFLDAGVKIDTGAALDHAAANGHCAVVKLLLENGADATKIWPLQSAIKGNHEDIVLQLLRAGTPPKTTLGWDQSTPLHWAARRGNMEILRLLLHADLDINARDKYHRTPLHYATRKDVVKVLIESGAKVRVQDLAHDVTPLHDAARRGDRDVVKLLLDAGADPNAETEDGNTAIDLADIAGHQEIVAILRRHKGKKAGDVKKPEEVLQKDDVLPEPEVRRGPPRKKRRR